MKTKLIVLMLILLSCNDETIEQPKGQIQLVSIHKTVYNTDNSISTGIIDFKYNQKGLLTEGFGHYTYNENDQLIEIRYSDYSTFFEYENNLVVKVIYQYRIFNTESTNYFEYNTQGEINKYIIETPFYTVVYNNFIYDTNGNRTSYANAAQPNQRFISTYDEKNNPYTLFYDEAVLKTLFHGKNNKLKDNDDKTMVYEYNSENYPIKQTTYYEDQLESIIIYNYITL